MNTLVKKLAEIARLICLSPVTTAVAQTVLTTVSAWLGIADPLWYATISIIVNFIKGNLLNFLPTEKESPPPIVMFPATAWVDVGDGSLKPIAVYLPTHGRGNRPALASPTDFSEFTEEAIKSINEWTERHDSMN